MANDSVTTTILLRIYKPGSDLYVPIREYLAARAAGQADWIPSLLSCSLSVPTGDGADPISEWNLGDVDVIVEEMEEAARRLGAGKRAVIRSAIEDAYNVPYVLMEPDQNGFVRFMLTSIPMIPEDIRYPINRYGAAGEDAEGPHYAWIEQHWNELPVREDGMVDVPDDFRYPLIRLIPELEREAAAGRAILELLGPP